MHDPTDKQGLLIWHAGKQTQSRHAKHDALVTTLMKAALHKLPSLQHEDAS